MIDVGRAGTLYYYNTHVKSKYLPVLPTAKRRAFDHGYYKTLMDTARSASYLPSFLKAGKNFDWLVKLFFPRAIMELV